MSVDTMRAILKKQYHGAYKWIFRVNNMSDSQVIAVYKQMQGSGQLKS